MNLSELEKKINESFENKDKINTNSDKSIISAIKETIELTDQGKIRVAEKKMAHGKINNRIKNRNTKSKENKKKKQVKLKKKNKKKKKIKINFFFF